MTVQSQLFFYQWHVMRCWVVMYIRYAISIEPTILVLSAYVARILLSNIQHPTIYPSVNEATTPFSIAWRQRPTRNSTHHGNRILLIGPALLLLSKSWVYLWCYREGPSNLYISWFPYLIHIYIVESLYLLTERSLFHLEGVVDVPPQRSASLPPSWREETQHNFNHIQCLPKPIGGVQLQNYLLLYVWLKWFL